MRHFLIEWEDRESQIVNADDRGGLASTLFAALRESGLKTEEIVAIKQWTEVEEPPKTLKLFVWEDVLEDYTPGIMFALAYDVEHAKQLIIQREPNYIFYEDFEKEPRVIENPEGFVVFGGA